MTAMVYRGIGHPWTCEPGWDQLYLGADDRTDLTSKIAEAVGKFWKVWYHSESTNRVHLFKPSGATADWQDVKWQGTPRAHGHQFKVGDEVYTDYARPRESVTFHRVLAIQPSLYSQTGVQLRVEPPPRGSVFISDQGQPAGGPPWMDSAWFRKVL